MKLVCYWKAQQNQSLASEIDLLICYATPEENAGNAGRVLLIRHKLAKLPSTLGAGKSEEMSKKIKMEWEIATGRLNNVKKEKSRPAKAELGPYKNESGRVEGPMKEEYRKRGGNYYLSALQSDDANKISEV